MPVLTRVFSLWVLLGLCLQLPGLPVMADQQGQVDDTFDFVTTRDVPYVPSRLDHTVDPLQTLDIYRPGDIADAPVILYIHGGGWAFGDKKDVHLKPYFFTLQGFAFVSMNYRLRWDYKVYDQLIDIVHAVDWLARHGREYNLDGSRVILMGHAAGGHLASLVATDPSYLAGEGVSGSGIRAVVSIDSISYDISRLMRELGSFVERRQHELIFTDREQVWQAASPISHVGTRSSLPAFALLYDPERQASNLQARGFARALGEAGAQVVMIPGASDSPERTDELIGAAGNVATGALMAFIRSQI